MPTTKQDHEAILAAASKQAKKLAPLTKNSDALHFRGALVSLLLSGNLENAEAKFADQFPELEPEVKEYLAARRTLQERFSKMRKENDDAKDEQTLKFLRTIDPECDYSQRIRGVRCTFYTTRGARTTITVKNIRNVQMDKGVISRIGIDFSKNDDGCSDMSALEVRNGRILFDDEDHCY